jgi:Uma2 family endonuclease
MIKILTKPKPKRRIRAIGPEDDGRRMSLNEFDHAVAREGYLYELNKGVIEVSDVPHPDHGRLLQEVRDQLTAYKLSRPEIVHYLSGGSDAKLLIGPSESERHPDLSVYLSRAPEVLDVWSVWVPAVVIEIVSQRSAKRDYEDKPAEYLEFGVDEYWIIDSAKNQMTLLSRWRGQWKKQIIKPPAKFKSLQLPGFTLDLKRVFSAIK